MSPSPYSFRDEPSRDSPERTTPGDTDPVVTAFQTLSRACTDGGGPAHLARRMARVFLQIGAAVFARVVGRERASRAVIFETILGAALSGTALALLVWIAACHSLRLSDALEVGAGVGAGIGTCLHLLILALEEYAKDQKRKFFGDN